MSYQTEGTGRLFKITASGARHATEVGEATVNRGDFAILQQWIHGGGYWAWWPQPVDEIYFNQNQPLTFDCTPNIEASFICADDQGRAYVISMPGGSKIYANRG